VAGGPEQKKNSTALRRIGEIYQATSSNDAAIGHAMQRSRSSAGRGLQVAYYLGISCRPK